MTALVREEYCTFIEGIKQVFEITTLTETCPATCRDGTACLNRAKYKDYCWRHRDGEMPKPLV